MKVRMYPILLIIAIFLGGTNTDASFDSKMEKPAKDPVLGIH